LDKKENIQDKREFSLKQFILPEVLKEESLLATAVLGIGTYIFYNLFYWFYYFSTLLKTFSMTFNAIPLCNLIL
jgi:hypothetical protein